MLGVSTGNMIPGISTRLLKRLIEIGLREAFDEFYQLFEDFPKVRSGRQLIQPFAEWDKVARRYSHDEIIALIKALTVWERDWPNVGWGSTSPVIPLYRYLLESARDDLTELRDWVIAHTKNFYLPFGGRYRPASLSEYHDLVAQDEARRRAREQAEDLALAARRAARKKRQGEQQQARLHRRQTRAVLIESLRHLSPAERLEHIIADTKRSVSFYPSEWAVLDSATIQTLPSQLRLATIQRLADRRTGIWKRLRVQLERNA